MWYKSASSKKMFIMRGVPGSGKSYLAKQLKKKGVVLSTDDFFGPNYDFDGSKLPEAHRWNIERATEAAKSSVTPIVIDNTNIKLEHMKPYVEIAQKFGYDVEFRESETEWKRNVDELVERNTHSVPRHVIERMLNQWEDDPTIEKILGKVQDLEQPCPDCNGWGYTTYPTYPEIDGEPSVGRKDCDQCGGSGKIILKI